MLRMGRRGGEVTDTGQTLVGRDRELQLLERLLDEARAGSSRFVVIAGEPGIGKSFLLADLARRADTRGCLVLEGRAAELERELPFGLVVDAFDAYLESLDARAFGRLGADDLGELGTVFPSLRALDPGSDPPSTVTERFRAHRAVRELIERLAARQPVVLTLDDLQWSDGASAELIAHLVRRPPEAAVMVAATMRTGRTDATLAGAIEAAARAGDLTQVALGPLDPDAAAKLVEPGGDGDRLYRESGGNPFYLLALARTHGDGTSARVEAPSWGPQGVPAPVIAAIGAELEDLPAPARGFAQAAAVTGDPFELDLAVATAAAPEADALIALDELIARDVIRPARVPRTFQFRHPLVRSAVYASCSPGVRLVAHERSAEALAARGAPATARAHHVEQCGRHGDLAAVAVLREAGQAAARRAPTSSARWFEAALRILPATASAAERAELLMALAGAQGATGKLDESRAALLEALELAADDGGVPRVRLISACAAVEHLLGRHREAHARLVAALEGLPESAASDRAALMIDLSLDAFYGMQYDGMREWGARALDAARPLHDRPLTAAAAAILAFAESCAGPIPDAQAHRAEAAGLVDAMPDDELSARLDAVGHLSAAEFYLDRYEEAAAHAERGLAVARATSQGDFFPGLTQALGNVMFMSGRLSEAAELLDGAVEAARLSDIPVALAWTLLNRAYAAVIAGEIDDALRAGEEARTLTRGLDGSVVAAWAGAVCAFALLESGEPARAAELLVISGGGEAAPLIPGAWRANWLEVLTRCYLALGRHDDARLAASRSQARAEEFGLRLATALAHRAAAAVALDAGDARTAAERALASAGLAEEVGARVEGALSRALAGRALAQVGDADRAVAELERAAGALETCGALRHRDMTERELRALGHTVHRRTRRARTGAEGLDALTGRELEVARLVVDRRTNPEIAAELFLSVKTVETHLRNIFRKIGASSRVDLARAVERADRAS
jgi:DNA-binding CsgD family transcriptional regulator/tetratricopeptide (TPR) repeat protein